MTGASECALIGRVVREIVALLSPEAIYIYNRKADAAGRTTSFKLCMILAAGDKAQAEHDVYMAIESEIPFDVIGYTSEEWARISREPATFASRILHEGTKLYG